MASDLPADAPAPRLCHLVKWPDFDGYGFNLHAEKAKTGQFIGKVDEGSPAEKAGLKEGDRIIEVNGVNIANENHRQVVERIKAMVNETKLLVLDEEADMWYKERKLVVKGTQSNVIYKKTPSSQSAKNDEVSTHNAINGSKESKNSVSTEHEPKIEAQESKKQSQVEENANGIKKIDMESQNLSSVNGKSSPKIKREENEEPKEVKDSVKAEAQNGTSSNGSGANINNNNNSSVKKSSTQQPIQQNSSTNSSVGKADNKEDLNLNMSAAQMREMLANRKKRDPRKQTLDMKEKYQIVQQM